MDLQQWIEKAVADTRKAKFDNSDQLSLGDMITKLEPIVERQKDREDEATVKYDFEYLYPSTIDSWRGSYAELALDYKGFDSEYKPMKVSDFLKLLKETVGKEFTGYKGGEYVMDENTPVWVANYGNSGNTAVIEIVDDGYQVIIITGMREY